MGTVHTYVGSIDFPAPSRIAFHYPKDWGPESMQVWGAENFQAGVKQALQKVGTTLVGSGGAKSLHAHGMAINKREAAIFRNLLFRRVDLQWLFMFDSPGDFNTVRDTVQDLKERSAPRAIYDGALWEYPETFTIVLKSDSGTLFQSPQMAITDIGIDYTPNGFWSQHKDGNPTSVSVEIALSDMELATRDALESGLVV